VNLKAVAYCKVKTPAVLIWIVSVFPAETVRHQIVGGRVADHGMPGDDRAVAASVTFCGGYANTRFGH
jgi:hypothetical protein